MNTVCILLSVANKFNFEIEQIDVKTAFLNGELEKPVFMLPPDEMNIPKGKVLKLTKALYGLKISPKQWNSKLKETLEKLGFCKFHLNPCLFIWRHKHKICTILIYVDDILISGNCKNKIAELKVMLKRTFEMMDIGEVNKYLGM